jgi:hypothetical protein
MKDKTGYTIPLQCVSYWLNMPRVPWYYRRHGTHVLTNILINYSDGGICKCLLCMRGRTYQKGRENNYKWNERDNRDNTKKTVTNIKQLFCVHRILLCDLLNVRTHHHVVVCLVYLIGKLLSPQRGLMVGTREFLVGRQSWADSKAVLLSLIILPFILHVVITVLKIANTK